jgi:hypothetical protein
MVNSLLKSLFVAHIRFIRIRWIDAITLQAREARIYWTMVSVDTLPAGIHAALKERTGTARSAAIVCLAADGAQQSINFGPPLCRLHRS